MILDVRFESLISLCIRTYVHVYVHLHALFLNELPIYLETSFRHFYFLCLPVLHTKKTCMLVISFLNDRIK